MTHVHWVDLSINICTIDNVDFSSCSNVYWTTWNLEPLEDKEEPPNASLVDLLQLDVANFQFDELDPTLDFEAVMSGMFGKQIHLFLCKCYNFFFHIR